MLLRSNLLFLVLWTPFALLAYFQPKVMQVQNNQKISDEVLDKLKNDFVNAEALLKLHSQIHSLPNSEFHRDDKLAPTVVHLGWMSKDKSDFVNSYLIRQFKMRYTKINLRDFFDTQNPLDPDDVFTALQATAFEEKKQERRWVLIVDHFELLDVKKYAWHETQEKIIAKLKDFAQNSTFIAYDYAAFSLQTHAHTFVKVNGQTRKFSAFDKKALDRLRTAQQDAHSPMSTVTHQIRKHLEELLKIVQDMSLTLADDMDKAANDTLAALFTTEKQHRTGKLLGDAVYLLTVKMLDCDRELENITSQWGMEMAEQLNPQDTASAGKKWSEAMKQFILSQLNLAHLGLLEWNHNDESPNFDFMHKLDEKQLPKNVIAFLTLAYFLERTYDSPSHTSIESQGLHWVNSKQTLLKLYQSFFTHYDELAKRIGQADQDLLSLINQAEQQPTCKNPSSLATDSAQVCNPSEQYQQLKTLWREYLHKYALDIFYLMHFYTFEEVSLLNEMKRNDPSYTFLADEDDMTIELEFREREGSVMEHFQNTFESMLVLLDHMEDIHMETLEQEISRVE